MKSFLVRLIRAIRSFWRVDPKTARWARQVLEEGDSR